MQRLNPPLNPGANTAARAEPVDSQRRTTLQVGFGLGLGAAGLLAGITTAHPAHAAAEIGRAHV